MKTNHYGERILADNLTVSNDTRETGLNNNDLIIGASGAGKTGGYVIPNIRNITGSLVVSDTKGNLEKKFRKELIQKGYTVYTLNLVEPLLSCGYNPLSAIRRYHDGSYREQDVLTLANALCPCINSKDPIWEKSAATYIAFLIAYCLERCPRKEQNILSICELHRAFIQPGGDLPFIKWGAEHRDTFPARKYYEMKANEAADRMRASIIGFVNEALGPFEFKEAKHIFDNPWEFDIRTLGRKKTVLFLNVSDTDKTYDSLVNLFYTQALQVLCDEADHNADSHLKVPVRIIMDDFATSACVENFDKIISVIRSRDISVSLILQSMTQLESLYSEAKAATIMNNCDHILYLGTQDTKTAEFISYHAFQTPETILCMPRDKAYLLTNGERAKLVDKVKPYSAVAEKVQTAQPAEYISAINPDEEEELPFS